MLNAATTIENQPSSSFSDSQLHGSQLLLDPAIFGAVLAQTAPVLAGAVISLRDYQEECVESILRLYREEGENRLIVQLATGGGKTIIFAYVAMLLNVPTLILAHRDELLTQAIAKIRYVWPTADIGRVQGEHNQTGHQITVGSVQTLSRKRRFEQAFPTQFDIQRIRLVIVDEAHHAAAETYKTILGKFGLLEKGDQNSPLSLGVTATPLRGDKRYIGDVYDRFAYQWDIKQGIREGHLCDLRGYVLHFDNETFGEVHTVAGDYNQGELDKAVTNVARCEAIVDCWKDQASDRRTVVFCVSIQHAQMVASTFEKAGIKTGVIYDGLSPDKRRQILDQFEEGQLQVLCNCMILTEGWDCPPTNCIVVARPTQSQSLYLQMIGRGTRLYKDPVTGQVKENCLIVDVADVSSKHSITAPVTLGTALGLKDSSPKKEIQSIMKLIWDEEEEAARRKQARAKEMEFRDTNGGDQFDPLADEVSGARMRWVRGKGGYTLSLPQPQGITNSRHFLVVKRRKDWLWDIVHVKQTKEVNRGGYPQWVNSGEKFINEKFGLPTSGEAVSQAERYARDVTKKFYKVEKMRAKDPTGFVADAPATEKQLEMLRKFKKLSVDENGLPLPVTKLEASRLIDECFIARVKVTKERSDNELDIF